MGVIKMLLKIFSAGIGIAVTVLIIWFLDMKNIPHPCFINLEDSASALLM